MKIQSSTIYHSAPTHYNQYYTDGTVTGSDFALRINYQDKFNVFFKGHTETCKDDQGKTCYGVEVNKAVQYSFSYGSDEVYFMTFQKNAFMRKATEEELIKMAALKNAKIGQITRGTFRESKKNRNILQKSRRRRLSKKNSAVSLLPILLCHMEKLPLTMVKILNSDFTWQTPGCLIQNCSPHHFKQREGRP